MAGTDQSGDRTQETGVFRQEALDHHNGTAEDFGEVVRLSRAWVGAPIALLLLALTSGLVFAAVVTVNEYAEGPALVLSENRVHVTTPTDTTVESVEVAPGQLVEVGATLVRLEASAQRADVERTESEFNLLLIRSMTDPLDLSTRDRLASARVAYDAALARLGERHIKAPVAGSVSAVFVTAGARLHAGDSIASLVEQTPEFKVYMFLPASHRPLLRPGMNARIELTGFEAAYQNVRVEDVSNDVIGPDAVLRYLGPERAGALRLATPVVLVRGRLAANEFRSAGQSLAYFDGLTATARVPVRAHSLLASVLPWLRNL